MLKISVTALKKQAAHAELLNFTVGRIWSFHSGGFEEYHLLGYDAV
jgi:hypothetical protein